jgi:ribosomal protein S18 acetylase RimI-like enzyme
MSTSPRVRPAVAADAPELGRLAAALVRLHHDWDGRRFIPAPPDVEAGYAGFLAGQLREERSVVLVAELPERPGALVGYAYGTVNGRDWNMLLGPHGVVHDVYVDPEARRRGVARALTLALCEALERKGAPRVLLHSATANAQAQALFASLGFRPTMIEMTREAGGK